MINSIHKLTSFKPLLKQNLKFKLKPLEKLENIDILTIPSKIQDKDILAMFKGVLSLMREKMQQEQTDKYLKLQLKYTRLKYLYNRLKKSI